MSKRKTSLKERFAQAQFLLPMFWDSVTFPSDWTLEEIIDLHEFLFDESLKTLAKSGGGKALLDKKIEVLEWIFSHNIESNQVTVVNNKVVQINKMPKPLSFELCCLIMEVDPEAMQQQIFYNLESNFKKAITAYKKAA